MKVTWKDIGTVPNANEYAVLLSNDRFRRLRNNVNDFDYLFRFLDVVLNRTQRKTPTVIRPGFKISRIRSFYMRKVRYTAGELPSLHGKSFYLKVFYLVSNVRVLTSYRRIYRKTARDR